VLDLDLIRIDGGTQSRVELNQETVAEYAEAYKAGAEMPPVIVYFDGTDRWLADGFHRYFGAKAAGLSQIYENVIPGTLRDAIKYSLGTNGAHGLRRTNADKRKAVLTALNDDEWSALPHREIADICKVSREYVARLSSEAEASSKRSQDAVRVVHRQGRTYEQDTSNIGKTKPAAPQGKPQQGPKAEALRAEIKAAMHKDDAEQAIGQVAELEQRVTALTEQLTGAMAAKAELQAEYDSVVKILDAGDQLAAALLEAKTARDLSRVLQERINSMMTQISELQRSVKAWKKKAEATA